MSYQVIIGKCEGGSKARSFRDNEQEAVTSFLNHVAYALANWRDDQAEIHITNVVLMRIDNGTIETVGSIDFGCPHKTRNGRRRAAHA